MKKLFSLLAVMAFAAASFASLHAPAAVKPAELPAVAFQLPQTRLAAAPAAEIRKAPAAAQSAVVVDYVQAMFYDDVWYFQFFNGDSYKAEVGVYAVDEHHIASNYTELGGVVVVAVGDTAELISGSFNVTYANGYYSFALNANADNGQNYTLSLTYASSELVAIDYELYYYYQLGYGDYFGIYSIEDCILDLYDDGSDPGDDPYTPGTGDDDYDYSYESTLTTTINRTYSTAEATWNANYYTQDGSIGLALQAADGSDAAAFWFYVPSYTNNQVPAGTYNIDFTGNPGTVEASSGLYYDGGYYVIPAYYGTLDADGYLEELWFIVSGSVRVSYDFDGNLTIVVNGISAHGSTINITVTDSTDALEDVNADSAAKFFIDGQIVIRKNGVLYNALGQSVK